MLTCLRLQYVAYKFRDFTLFLEGESFNERWREVFSCCLLNAARTCVNKKMLCHIYFMDVFREIRLPFYSTSNLRKPFTSELKTQWNMNIKNPYEGNERTVFKTKQRTANWSIIRHHINVNLVYINDLLK